MVATLALGGCAARPSQGSGLAAPRVVDGLVVASEGAGLIVRSNAGAMGFDQGLAAKRAAQAACGAEGQRLDPAALGRFAGGAWVFDRGCL